MKSNRRRMLRALLVGAGILLTSACDSIADSIMGTYRGPPPSRDDIAAETVIVRTVSAHPATGILSCYVDRVRFLESDPHNINRVVQVTSRDIHPAVAALGLEVGDRIRISTQFLAYAEAGDLGKTSLTGRSRGTTSTCSAYTCSQRWSGSHPRDCGEEPAGTGNRKARVPSSRSADFPRPRPAVPVGGAEHRGECDAPLLADGARPSRGQPSVRWRAIRVRARRRPRAALLRVDVATPLTRC